MSGPEWAQGDEPVLNQLARAELVVKVRAADQPIRRLRGALGEPRGTLGEPVSAELDCFADLRIAGGILERAQVTAPIAPIEKRMLQFSVVFHRKILLLLASQYPRYHPTMHSRPPSQVVGAGPQAS